VGFKKSLDPATRGWFEWTDRTLAEELGLAYPLSDGDLARYAYQWGALLAWRVQLSQGYEVKA
jgi:hypothetical protein